MPQDRNGLTAASARARGLDARTERDHAAISDLADDLLPALIAKLPPAGLGEIESEKGSGRRASASRGTEDRKDRDTAPGDGHSGTATPRAAVGRERRAHHRR